MSQLDHYKQQAAERALELVQSGMVLGLGTGSTANFVLQGLAERLADGRLQTIAGVPTSAATAALASTLGIPLTTLDTHPTLDLAIDGADEVAPSLDVIKGLGAALLHEKIVAAAARQFVIIGDASKRVAVLGEHTPLPVEVIGFGANPCARQLAALGGQPVLRRTATGEPVITDEGNLIIDCRFGLITAPLALAAAIKTIPGVVEHGLFVGMASTAIIAGPAGVEVLAPVRATPPGPAAAGS